MSSNRPTVGQSARQAPPPDVRPSQPPTRNSQNTEAGQCRGTPAAPAPPMGAARREEKQSGRARRRIRIERPCGSRRLAGLRVGQSAASARGPRTLGPAAPPRAVVCGVGAAARAEPQHSPGGGGGGWRRRRRSWEREPGAAAQRHVGEHGRAAAPGHDQPVRAGRGLRGRPGAAAAASGPLAVRDRPKHVLSRKQHSQQPPPPADDVYSQQHPCHTTQLP